MMEALLQFPHSLSLLGTTCAFRHPCVAVLDPGPDTPEVLNVRVGPRSRPPAPK